MRTFMVLWLFFFGLPLSSQEPSPVQESLARAVASREAGKLEQALQVLEEALEAAPDEQALLEEKGVVAYLLARRNKEEGRGGGFFEAVLALEKAMEQGAERFATHLYLARVYRETGRTEEAYRMGLRALDLTEGEAEEGEARLEVGIAANGLLRQAEGEERAEWIQTALEHLTEATRLRGQDHEAWIFLSNTYAWAGSTREELRVLRKGLRRCPESEPLHAYLQDRLFALGLYEEAAGLARGLVTEQPENAVALWYLGRARLALAEELRREGEPERAGRAYQEALPLWQAAAQRAQRLRPASARAVATALLGLASLHIETKALAKAEQLLIQAYEEWPGIFDEADAFGASYASAMGSIGAALLQGAGGTDHEEDLAGTGRASAGRAASLDKCADFYRRLIARHPDRQEHLGYWYNNLGLALRDLGSALARGSGRGGETPVEAKAAWQESYQAYLKAVEFHPGDPRILNDTALVQVFHLGSDIEKAEELLRAAIEVGLELIEAEKESWTQERMQFLEEAVGNAWSNLGLLYTRYRNDREQGRLFSAEADNYYPRRQTEAAPRGR